MGTLAEPRPISASRTSSAGSDPGVVRSAMRAVLPFLLVAGVIAIRFPIPLFRAEFWAEDATEFFFDAVSLGLGSHFVPVYGYQFLLERLIAYGATFFPVFYAPFVYAWASLVVDAAALSYLARDGFSWIAPLRWQRVLLAVLLALGPGTADVLLNLANLPNPLALLGFLLLVERPFRMDGRKLVLFAFVVLSSGHMLLWFPVAAWLAWTQRSRGYLAAATIIAAVAVLNAAGTHEASRAAGSLDMRAISEVPWILIANAFARLVTAPLVGHTTAGTFQGTPPGLYWTVAAASLGVAAWVASRQLSRDRDGTVVLLLGYAGAIGMLGLVAVTRSYNVPVLARQSGSLLPLIRYSFLPAALATFLWSSWLLHPRPGGFVSAALRYGTMTVIAAQLATGFTERFPRPNLAWGERSRRVQWLLDLNRTSGRAVVITLGDLAIHPVGWIPDNRRVSVVVPGR